MGVLEHNFFLCPPLCLCVFLPWTWVLLLCPSFPPLLGVLFNKVYQGFIIFFPFFPYNGIELIYVCEVANDAIKGICKMSMKMYDINESKSKAWFESSYCAKICKTRRWLWPRPTSFLQCKVEGRVVGTTPKPWIIVVNLFKGRTHIDKIGYHFNEVDLLHGGWIKYDR